MCGLAFNARGFAAGRQAGDVREKWLDREREFDQKGAR